MTQSFEELSLMVDADAAKRQKCLAAAKRASARLKKDGNTEHQAEYLANICSDMDDRFGLGTQLCLEWTLDNYMALQFEKAYPLLCQIKTHLVEQGHTERNKLEYFNDCEAFSIDRGGKLTLVFGKQWHDEPRYLVIDETSDWNHRCYVRKVWRRTKLNFRSIVQPTLKHYRDANFDMHYKDGNSFRVYGDARDPGHVLSYERMFGRGKCDKVIWDIVAHTRFFFEVSTLWAQTVGDT